MHDPATEKSVVTSLLVPCVVYKKEGELITDLLSPFLQPRGDAHESNSDGAVALNIK